MSSHSGDARTERPHIDDRHGEPVVGLVRADRLVTVLSYDAPAARVYGQIRAQLESPGRPLADADLQIAAQLRISPALADARIRS